MQKKFLSPLQLLFVCLFAFCCIGLEGCKKTDDVQIACTLTSVKANAEVINSTLNPAKQGVAVQLSVFLNDSLVNKINRTHNGNTNFDIPGLKANTDYKVEIKIINDPNLVAEPCATTLKTLESNTPLITTSPIANITPAGADLGGNVTFEGLSPVLESGVCWATTVNPNIANPRIALGTGVGSFSTTLTTLNPSTIYHVRAYARTASAYFYGADLQFTTLAVIPTAPTVVTTVPSAITQTGVSTGGNVTVAGTTAVTSRGICWGVTVNPDITGTKTTNGTGTGIYTVNLPSLSPATTYHIRAYATNSIGTSYGADEVFTTLPIVAPSVTTADITIFTQTTATAGGNVTSNGGASVSALGVCYGTNPSPDLTGPFTNDGSGTGNYTSPLTGLNPGTLYYVRAYATNTVGTSYGAEKTFTTAP